ncbi:MAG: cytochrome ubiquinol oxidase subunit I [Candidatus Aminicenantia bacterium]
MIASISQLFLGPIHFVQVFRTQQEKFAAYEALWETTNKAFLQSPMKKIEKNSNYIGIPKSIGFPSKWKDKL